MKILILLALFFISTSGKSQSQITFLKLQKYLLTKSIDGSEEELKLLEYSFREIQTEPSGVSLVVYNKTNHKTRALDFIIFYKNPPNTSLPNIGFTTYEEELFLDLKAQCASINNMQKIPEQIIDNRLVRAYFDSHHQYQFSSYKLPDKNRVQYTIHLF